VKRAALNQKSKVGKKSKKLGAIEAWIALGERAGLAQASLGVSGHD
jgi:hypothetical protein